jgi:AraC-like DNA-binding protein
MAEAELAFERNEALDEAALSLAAAVLRASHESRSPVVTMRDEHRAAGIARLLESTFVRHHSLATLAAQAGISPFHFLRVFRKATGATPRQFLLRLRLRAAVRLLRTTPMRVTDIAYAVGFGDLSHFVRSFRAEFGVAPSRARQPGWSQREIMVRSSAPTLNLSL